MSTAAVLGLALLVHAQASANIPHPPGRAESKRPAALTLLFFTASWCEPCRAVRPILEKFARKNEKRVELVEIDFDRAKAEAARWNVREIPVVVVLSAQGQVLLRCDGAQPQALASPAAELDKLLRNSKERK